MPSVWNDARREVLGYDGTVLLRLGNYQLEHRLGPEGAVETYLARIAENDATDKQIFAVKVLRADRMRGDSFRTLAARFLAAGQRLQDAQGPGIARVPEVSQSEMGVYVVSDFVVGVDLAGLLKAAHAQSPDRQSALDPAMVSMVGAKLARVLAGAHAARPPLHHLGLCPGNVVVTLTGEVMVLDFGLFASVRGLMDHGIDKWAFVAPELLGADLDDGHPTDGAAADLFSLGGLLFYLLSGRPPVEAKSLADLYDRTWETLPALPGVPERLNAAIRALTAPDPQDRCREVEQAVAWLTGVGDTKSAIVAGPVRDTLGRGIVPTETAIVVPKISIPAVSRRKPAAIASGAVSAARRDRRARSGWPVVLVALLGAGIIGVFGLLAFRLARTFAAKRAAVGVAIAQRRSGETPEGALPAKLAEPLLSPESWLPAIPTPLPDAGRTRAADAASPRPLELDPLPVSPAGRFVMEESDATALKRVPNHLSVDTQPHGAHVWIDGVWKGNTPLDVVVGAGDRRLVLVAAGHRMIRETFDAREGSVIRLALDRVVGPVRGDAFLNVICRTSGKYMVFIDEVETGLFCPASHVPVPAGAHHVGVFVPADRKLVAVEVMAPAGPKPVEVRLAP